MSKDALMVKQVAFVIAVRRIKTLGIAILLGILAIYAAGLFVAHNNVKEDFDLVNLISLVMLLVLVPVTFLVKSVMMKKVNLSNFMNSYFSVHVIAFVIMDFASLFCITTNLFVNGNILYASIGAAVAVGGMILLFPREEDFEKIKAADLSQQQ